MILCSVIDQSFYGQSNNTQTKFHLNELLNVVLTYLFLKIILKLSVLRLIF